MSLRSPYPSELKAEIVSTLKTMSGFYTLLAPNQAMPPLGVGGRELIRSYSAVWPTEENAFKFELDLEPGMQVVFYNGMLRPRRGKTLHSVSILSTPPPGVDADDFVHRSLLQGVVDVTDAKYFNEEFQQICFSGNNWALEPPMQIQTIRDTSFPMENAAVDVWRINLNYPGFEGMG